MSQWVLTHPNLKEVTLMTRRSLLPAVALFLSLSGPAFAVDEKNDVDVVSDAIHVVPDAIHGKWPDWCDRLPMPPPICWIILL